ncbi:MAG: hypothetical protein AAGA75_14705 [Cyanobacteria bacterium P01_E01_bin.6]
MVTCAPPLPVVERPVREEDSARHCFRPYTTSRDECLGPNNIQESANTDQLSALSLRTGTGDTSILEFRTEAQS